MIDRACFSCGVNNLVNCFCDEFECGSCGKINPGLKELLDQHIELLKHKEQAINDLADRLRQCHDGLVNDSGSDNVLCTGNDSIDGVSK